VRITPTKWDAEYSWINHEDGVRAIGTSPVIRLPERERRTGVFSSLGMALQTIGAAILGFFALDAEALLLLPLGTVLFGELIFISSLNHGGVRSPGE